MKSSKYSFIVNRYLIRLKIVLNVDINNFQGSGHMYAPFSTGPSLTVIFQFSNLIIPNSVESGLYSVSFSIIIHNILKKGKKVEYV